MLTEIGWVSGVSKMNKQQRIIYNGLLGGKKKHLKTLQRGMKEAEKDWDFAIKLAKADRCEEIRNNMPWEFDFYMSRASSDLLYDSICDGTPGKVIK